MLGWMAYSLDVVSWANTHASRALLNTHEYSEDDFKLPQVMSYKGQVGWYRRTESEYHFSIFENHLCIEVLKIS